MPKLPRITADQAIKVVEKYGFKLVRQSGSHKIFRKGTQRITIPYHAGKILHPKIVKNIIDTLEISNEEFIKNL